MKTRQGILIAGLLLAVGEPSYHWKSVSGWLETYGPGPAGYRPSPEADEALRHIGARAVPTLLSLLQANDPSARTNAVALTPPPPPLGFASLLVATNLSVKVRATTWVEKHLPFRLPQGRVPASWDHWRAYLGFQALGPLGKSALPDLVKLAHDPSDINNPGGTGMAPFIDFWKKFRVDAQSATQSATDLGPVQSVFNGSFNASLLRQVILGDGDIAALSLAAIGADSVPPLLEMLADPNPRLRCRAAVALGLMGAAAEPAVPALVKMLHDPDMNTRWEATDALGCIGRRSDLAVPALIQALADPDGGMQFTAMKSLGDFGAGAINAIPALLAFFPSRDTRFGRSAASALIKISRDTTEKEVLPFLLREIKDSQYPYNRALDLDTLSEASYEPQIVIPALMEAIDDTNSAVRIYGIIGLGRFGPAASAAIPKLTALTSDPDTNICAKAVAALQKIAPTH